jgi:hypothetical protein
VRRVGLLSFAIAAMLGVLAACGTFIAAEDDGRDASSDGGSNPDGATAGDSSSAEGSASADGAPPYVTMPCTPAPTTFCSYFDDGTPAPGFNWVRVGPSDGKDAGMLGARTDFVATPPRAARVQTAGATSFEQWLEMLFPDAVSGTIRLAVRVDAFDATTVQFLTLNCDSGGDAARVSITTDHELALSAAGTSIVHRTPSAIAPATWSAVELEFAKNGSMVATKLTFAGATTPPIGFDDCTPPLKVRLGATLVQAAAYDLSFDDVAVSWK